MGQHRVRILVASYGGGHVQSLLPIVRQLVDDPDVDLKIIGFTTALASFHRAGIDADGYASLLESDDEHWLDLARAHIEYPLHPDVSEEDSLAYYAIGLRDLHIDHGAKQAMAMFRNDGRKAFLPVHAMRRYLRRFPCDLVVTTASPRSELALLRAARQEGIETLALSDLFLQYESSYICAPGYANHITVMARAVGDSIAAAGFPTEHIHVTGNPAFDSLFDEKHRMAAQAFRKEIGLAPHTRLLLWACPSAPVSLIGKPFIDPSTMIEFLEGYCTAESNTRYLVRQHPSKPVVPHDLPLKHGTICPPATAIETCLHACDQVILETSTVGLQAALLGKPVVTVGAGDYPPYAAFGLATDVPSLATAAAALQQMTPPTRTRLDYPADGRSTARVHALIQTLSGLRPAI